MTNKDDHEVCHLIIRRFVQLNHSDFAYHAVVPRTRDEGGSFTDILVSHTCTPSRPAVALGVGGSLVRRVTQTEANPEKMKHLDTYPQIG
jgi:hypothetical protein